MKKKIIIMLLVVAVPIFLYGTITFAKYVTERFFSYYTNSKNFYFTSNILKEDNPLYQINNWVGIGQFTINYDLLSKKNDYVYTDYDITYEAHVTCPQDVLCEIDKPTGTIYAASHSDTVKVTVVPQRLFTENEKITIQLNAKTTSPYVKELFARYEYVVGKTGITYEIEDSVNSPYLLLKITNAINYCIVTESFGDYSVNDAIDVDHFMQLSPENKTKCVSQYANITINPYNILLDSTSEIIKKSTYSTSPGSNNYVNQLRFALDPVSSVALKFYKIYPTNNYANGNSSSIINIVFEDPQ